MLEFLGGFGIGAAIGYSVGSILPGLVTRLIRRWTTGERTP